MTPSEVRVFVTVGTFNLISLFSRFNFRAEFTRDQGGDGRALEASYTFSDPAEMHVRRYRGSLVRGKDDAGRGHVARRLLGTHEDITVPPSVDVWAVQEVEDIDTLRFSRQLSSAAGTRIWFSSRATTRG